jgi:hypothetical protein
MSQDKNDLNDCYKQSYPELWVSMSVDINHVHCKIFFWIPFIRISKINPTPPIDIKPINITSGRAISREYAIMKPNPLELAMSSATAIPFHALPNPSLIPINIEGKAAGKITRKMQVILFFPKSLATSKYLGSIPLMPPSVFMKTDQKQPIMIKTILAGSLMPNVIMHIGIQATLGTHRATPIITVKAAFIRGNKPVIVPTVRPKTVPKKKPNKKRCMLMQKYSKYFPFFIYTSHVVKIFNGEGSMALFMSPFSEDDCQRMIKTIGSPAARIRFRLSMRFNPHADFNTISFIDRMEYSPSQRPLIKAPCAAFPILAYRIHRRDSTHKKRPLTQSNRTEASVKPNKKTRYAPLSGRRKATRVTTKNGYIPDVFCNYFVHRSCRPPIKHTY